MKKRWILLVAGVLLLLAVAFCSDSKGMAVNHVLRNQEKLTAHALQCIDQPEHATRYGSWDTEYNTTYDIVEFQVSYVGFGSESDEKGFYYTPKDEALGLGNDISQETLDGGVKFHGEGDNYTYVEKITDHWYWYEIHW